MRRVTIQVHLYTYDLFAERTGFKLFWGCTVFYPFFYCIGMWPLLRSATYDDISLLSASLAIGLYVVGKKNPISMPSAADHRQSFADSVLPRCMAGWIMTRGANLQKFYMKVRCALVSWLSSFCGLLS